MRSSLYSHLNSRTWTESKRKLPRGLDAAFFKTVFQVVKKKLCRVQVYLRKETLQPAQVALTKKPRNEAKIYQETDFLSTEGHLVTASGCFLTGRRTGLICVCRVLFLNLSNLQALIFRWQTSNGCTFVFNYELCVNLFGNSCWALYFALLWSLCIKI